MVGGEGVVISDGDGLAVGEEFYVVDGDCAGSCTESEEVEVEGGVGVGGDVRYVNGNDLFVVEGSDGYFVALEYCAVGLDVEEGVGMV